MVCTMDHRRAMLQNSNSYKTEQAHSGHGRLRRCRYLGYTAAESLEHACKYLIAYITLRS